MQSLLLMMIIFLFLQIGYRHSLSRHKKKKHPGVFFRIWKNIFETFQGKYLWYYIAAVFFTIVLLYTGLETDIQLFFQRKNLMGKLIPLILLISGNFIHLLISLYIIIRSKQLNKKNWYSAGLASFQAVIATASLTFIQKLLTGRKGPKNIFGEEIIKAPFIKTENPFDFRFDFWNHVYQDGRFFWPSGHTATAFAFVAALCAYFPDKKIIAYIGYPLAAFMGLGMIHGDFHWTSDVIAGALIGQVLGSVIGKSYKKLQYNSFSILKK